MNRMTPDLARLLVADRLEEAEQLRRRPATRDEASTAPKVPRQRRGSGLLGRIVPQNGVRTPAR